MSQTSNSGMDIDLGNECSKNAYNWSKKTFINRSAKAGMPATDLEGGFSNLLYFGDTRIGIASDGIGTKIELAERSRIYDSLGYDLIAMVADDLASAGFEPTNISNIIDVDHLNYEVIDQLMKGLHDAANFAQIAISGGEIAELGNRIGGYGEGMHFNWCSTAIGQLHPSLKTPINGKDIKAGDKVISLRSRGFRSNGFSLIRRVMLKEFGEEWHKEAYDDSKTWGEVLLTPSLIFSPAITNLLENGISLKGVGHITGGGIADNFRRVLKLSGKGAILNDLYPPHEVMLRLIDLAKVELSAAYLYWNMGNGMLIVVGEEQLEESLTTLTAANYEAKAVGTITDEKEIILQTTAGSLKYA